VRLLVRKGLHTWSVTGLIDPVLPRPPTQLCAPDIVDPISTDSNGKYVYDTLFGQAVFFSKENKHKSGAVVAALFCSFMHDFICGKN